MNIALPSVQSLLVQAMANDHELGTGTGFIVVHNNQPYLITNYHIAAGRRPSDGQPLHPSGAVPDILKVAYMLPPTANGLEWSLRDEVVVDVDNDQAMWFEHPQHGRSVDVVAVPLKRSVGTELHPYDLSGSAPPLRVGPAEGVSVVGFPFGLTAGGVFGIWTRGFMASEPDVDWNDLPCFLIDARARQGQSGSPVIAYSPGGATELADGKTAFFGGAVVNLLGVYSGRINEKSDLGIVWKV